MEATDDSTVSNGGTSMHPVAIDNPDELQIGTADDVEKQGFTNDNKVKSTMHPSCDVNDDPDAPKTNEKTEYEIPPASPKQESKKSFKTFQELIDQVENDNTYEKSKDFEDTLTDNDETDHGVDDIMSILNIKDFAYTISDPRHFGIYEDEDDTDEENDDDEDEDEEYYDNTYNQYINQRHIMDSNGEENSDQNNYIEDTSNKTGDRGRDQYYRVSYDDGTQHSGVNTPTDEFGNTDILHAVALYEFTPENSNELPLIPNQMLIINYECGDGWLVAHDPSTGQTGLVPTEYIRILEINADEEDFDDVEEYSEFAEDAKDAQRFMPGLLADYNSDNDTNIKHNNNNSDKITTGINNLSL